VGFVSVLEYLFRIWTGVNTLVTNMATLLKNVSSMSEKVDALSDQVQQIVAGLPAPLAPPGPVASMMLIWSPLNKENLMADLTFADSASPEVATLVLLDATGAPTTADSPPVWVSGDTAGTFFTIVTAADGLSSTATPVSPGSAVVTITVQDNANEDGTPGAVVTGQTTVTVTAGEAASLAVSWAPPVVVPTPAP
jgi:hypothetical protein